MLNLELSRDDLEEEERAYISELHSKCAAQERIYRFLFTHRGVFLATLIVFDIITLQLPYFLK